MYYRFAKSCDAARIAEIQTNIKDVNSLGIFCHMGKSFLKTYYKLIIEDPQSIFICAIDDNDLIVGYDFVELDAAKHNQYMNKHKIKLMFSAISSIILKPSLLSQLFKRYRALRNNDDTYLHTKGAHGGYWGWDPNYPDSESSIYLNEVTAYIAKLMGVTKISFEVDYDNPKVLKFHKLNGAKIERELVLPDGRKRAFMYYDLTTKKFRL